MGRRWPPTLPAGATQGITAAVNRRHRPRAHASRVSVKAVRAHRCKKAGELLLNWRFEDVAVGHVIPVRERFTAFHPAIWFDHELAGHAVSADDCNAVVIGRGCVVNHVPVQIRHNTDAARFSWALDSSAHPAVDDHGVASAVHHHVVMISLARPARGALQDNTPVGGHFGL